MALKIKRSDGGDGEQGPKKRLAKKKKRSTSQKKEKMFMFVACGLG